MPIRSLTTIVAFISLIIIATASHMAHAGGCDITVYWDMNFGGESWRTQHDSPYVGDHWNDQISSIVVSSGNWDFYWDAYYKGEVLRLKPGSYAYVGDHWNDQISSFRCTSPTN